MAADENDGYAHKIASKGCAAPHWGDIIKFCSKTTF